MNVSEIEFVPINPNGGHIGFVKFLLNDELVFNGVAVHTLRNGTGFRLVYPAIHGLQCCYPIRRELAEFITNEVSEKCFKFFS